MGCSWLIGLTAEPVDPGPGHRRGVAPGRDAIRGPGGRRETPGPGRGRGAEPAVAQGSVPLPGAECGERVFRPGLVPRPEGSLASGILAHHPPLAALFPDDPGGPVPDVRSVGLFRRHRPARGSSCWPWQPSSMPPCGSRGHCSNPAPILPHRPSRRLQMSTNEERIREWQSALTEMPGTRSSHIQGTRRARGSSGPSWRGVATARDEWMQTGLGA
jgi:hypothetical protein